MMEELGGLTDAKLGDESYYDQKKRYVKNFKKVALMLMKAASDKFGRNLIHEQEIINNISDIIMQLYGTESALLRVQKLEGIKGESAGEFYRQMLDVFTYDAANRIRKFALDSIYSFVYGEDRDNMLKGVKHYTCVEGVNVKEARRSIADMLISENRYCF